MDRNFALPLAIATAIHIGVFYGFPKTKPSAPAAARAVIELKDPIPMPPPEEEPPLVSDDSEKSDDAAPPAPRPTGAEVPATHVDAKDFPMERPLTPAVDVPGVKTLTPYTPGRVGGVRGSVIPSGLLDNPPRTRLQIQPPYPPQAVRDGREGTVTVEFTVDETGRVLEPRIVDSTDRVFDEATLHAIAKWRFEPGKRDGRVVRFRMSVPVVFNLNKD